MNRRLSVDLTHLDATGELKHAHVLPSFPIQSERFISSPDFRKDLTYTSMLILILDISLFRHSLILALPSHTSRTCKQKLLGYYHYLDRALQVLPLLRFVPWEGQFECLRQEELHDTLERAAN